MYNAFLRTVELNGVRLAHHISLARMVTYLYYIIFLIEFLEGNIWEKFQKDCSASFISKESP